jgi:hypothetical protein
MLCRLAGLATHQRYEMGDLLFLPGQDASQVYFIVSGEVGPHWHLGADKIDADASSW